MTDPFAALVLAGAASGAAQEVTRSVIESLKLRSQRRSGLTPAAVFQADENLTAFVKHFIDLVRQQSAGTGDNPLSSLDNPDVGYLLASVADVASRTSSAERHKILATLVQERMAASDESSRATTAAHAASIMPQLGKSHLRLLSLLIAVQDHIPEWIKSNSLQKEPDGILISLPREAYLERHQEFQRWSRALFDAIGAPDSPPDHDLMTLVSVGAIVAGGRPIDLPVRLGDLTKRSQGGDPSISYSAFFLDMSWAEHHPLYVWLAKHWTQSTLLNIAALTPVGLLLGLATIDAVQGTQHLQTWEWGGSRMATFPEPLSIEEQLDSIHFEEKVVRAIESQGLTQRQMRGEAHFS